MSVGTPSSSTAAELEQVGPRAVASEKVVGRPSYSETARRALVSTVVVLAVVVGALALWKLKVLLALLFASITIAAAMRPGVDWLHKHRIPRPLGVAIHYLGLLGLLALFLSFVVPDMISQVQGAMAAAEHHKLHTGSTVVDRVLSQARDASAAPAAGRLADPSRGLDRREGARGAGGDLLHLRDGRLLALRARPRDRPRGEPDAAAEAQDAPRHLGAHGPQARRLRARPAGHDRARLDARLDRRSGSSESPTSSCSGSASASSRSSP